ncbi:MAG: hypothetical protein C0410_08045 [Anaerolinea sp.]|nr:hypothetical protein [Anaerolinea sp.]
MDNTLAVAELEKAREARQNGNEGMARVLARRAAGLVIREYLQTVDFDLRGLSLNALIKDEQVRKVLPVSIHSALERLSTRIGMDYQFPVDFNLIMDAQNVIEQLSKVNGETND